MSELKKLREKQGMKRSYVAKQLGVCPDHLSVIERGSSPLNIVQIEKLSTIYNVSVPDMAEIALKTYKREVT